VVSSDQWVWIRYRTFWFRARSSGVGMMVVESSWVLVVGV
jgi:hypothetical protein